MISVSFANLTPAELELFSSNLINDTLQVSRKLLKGNPRDSGSFFVSAKAVSAFSDCRSESSKSLKREKYNELREDAKYQDLNRVTNADQIEDALIAWEAAHPELLEVVQLASFRGFTNVAAGQIKTKTDFIFVPAVRDAALDAGDAKGSPAKQLIETIARQTIENNSDYKSFISETNARLNEFTDPSKITSLKEIGNELSTCLRKYYKDSTMIATWNAITEISIPFPSAQISVQDGSIPVSVERVGHGLQRAIIISILEFLASRKMGTLSEEKFDVAQSDLIVAIEEPKIYQHPTKQRHIASVLGELSNAFNAESGIRIQLIYVTHSPLFVQLPKFEEIRISRRHFADGKNKVEVSQLSLEDCSNSLAAIAIPPKTPMTRDAFGAKLHIFNQEMCEGFFANKVVLVEGISDQAILTAFFRYNGRSPVADGIAIISCEGKKKIDKPFYIFNKLGIPTYVVLDNDEGTASASEKNYNRFIQSIAGVESSSHQDWPNGVYSNFAAFKGNMEAYIRSVVGSEFYIQVRDEMKFNFEVDADDCVKSPTIAAAMLTKFVDGGYNFDELGRIIEAVDRL